MVFAPESVATGHHRSQPVAGAQATCPARRPIHEDHDSSICSGIDRRQSITLLTAQLALPSWPKVETEKQTFGLKSQMCSLPPPCVINETYKSSLSHPHSRLQQSRSANEFPTSAERHYRLLALRTLWVQIYHSGHDDDGGCGQWSWSWCAAVTTGCTCSFPDSNLLAPPLSLFLSRSLARSLPLSHSLPRFVCWGSPTRSS